MEIRDSVALVTGGNRGIGAAIAKALLAAGASRVYLGTRVPVAPSERVVPIYLDVTDSRAIAVAAESCKGVSILVNNAGVIAAQPVLGPSLEGSELEMRVNYFGLLAMCRAFAPILARNGGGAIVNVLSIFSHVSWPPVAGYSASKAAAYSATQAIRNELAPQGTLVVGVMPGFVDTDLTRAVTLPKIEASAVADAIVAAVREGTEDVYPGAEAAAVAAAMQSDPKALEQQYGSLLIQS